MLGLRLAAVVSPSIRPTMGLVWQQQVRLQTTKPVTIPLKVIKPESAQEELARQRLRRPVAPHLSIYKWQVHSVSSAMERNTGLLLAGGLYLFSTSYLIAPWLGCDLSSAALVAAFSSLPVAAKVVLKFFAAWPFTFHLFNGIRYIVSSTGYTLDSKSQFIKIAWVVVGSSALAAVGLVAYV
ncbi:putative cytochrome b subunit of succinate dehydrogenase [Aspergillus granulosus]|uniref:Cytochrome b subunit of succinate dehydrogenase n=1 Tax=Aspergillus granulosus TaxID=176169 RepID=A0ABR4GSL6_9EURO